MGPFDTAQGYQSEAAAQRFADRAAERRRNIDLVQSPGGVSLADSPERVAKRLDRLSRYYAGEPLPTSPAAEAPAQPELITAAALERAADAVAPAGVADAATRAMADGPPADVHAAGELLEKIILTPDFVGVRYLDAGVLAARAVSRVDIRDQAGRVVGYGTGSLVS